ncbi:MAG: response regulator [bacterium]
MARILIVEDDAGVAEALQFVLHKNNYTTDHAKNIALAEKLSAETDYHCTILDVWLGQEDGLSFLVSQRQYNNDRPFIIISGGGPGRSLENVTARADALGAVAVLYKPFDDTELLTTLEKIITP